MKLLVATLVTSYCWSLIPCCVSASCSPSVDFAEQEEWLQDVREHLQAAGLPPAASCPTSSEKQKVLLIGIDGFRADAAAMLPLTGIRRLMSMGKWSFWAKVQATGSAVSGPGWTSMLTGYEVSKHKVDGNGDLTDVAKPNFLKTAKDALGKRVAATVSWHPVANDIIGSFDPSTLDELYEAPNDRAMASKAVEWIENENFDVIFMDFDAVDGAGHGNEFSGYEDPYQNAVMNTDEDIQRVLDAIAKRSGEEWLILMTTDHGGRGTSHFAADDYNRRIPLIVAGNSPRINIGPAPSNDPGSQMDILPTVHHFLGIPIPEDVDGQVFGFNDATRLPPPVCTIPDPSTCGCVGNQQTEYRGTISVTKSGKTCQRWDSQTPHSHTRTPDSEAYANTGLEANYCRNPDGEEGAWCYTEDPDTRWELCNVPACPEGQPITTTAPTTVSTTSTTEELVTSSSTTTSTSSTSADPTTCGSASNLQADYRGTVAVTATGKTCQRWDSQSPHRHSRTPDNYPLFGLEENYCRNPDGEDGAWCYTIEEDSRWELCDIPTCPDNRQLRNLRG